MSAYSIDDVRRLRGSRRRTSREKRPRSEYNHAGNKPRQQPVDDDYFRRAFEDAWRWIFVHRFTITSQLMSFAVLTFPRSRGTDAAPVDSMKVYWLGLAGWLLILSLQLFLARTASAKRRAPLKEAAQK